MAGTRTGVVGPTAAGKTQLLYALTGLIQPDTGSIEYDGKPISEYDPESLHDQIGFVFQDSILFNISVRENIAFNTSVTDVALDKAIETGRAEGFYTWFAGGICDDRLRARRQFIRRPKTAHHACTCARARSENFLLDDFTARVDTNTEQKILGNIKKNYPDITLVSVTQKIAAVEHYDQIVVMMEGEVLATGTHAELLKTSPEYVQIVDSQRSTNTYRNYR